jgi:glyoxylase-like metal-dependent hydrolase (beta-lactamase superfamily II)
MLRKSLFTLAFVLPVGIGAFSSDAAQVGGAGKKGPQGPQTGKLEQIIPGHYVYSSGPRISGVIATNEGVVVVDALTDEAMAKHERELIANTIRQPIKYLVSSTFHGNYVFGSVAYQDAIRIGTENFRVDLINLMKEEKMTAAQQAAILPHATFNDKMTIYVGGKEIQLIYLGRAHTRGDAVVFVPQDRIVYLSEVFFDARFPFMNDGYVEWIETIDKALKLEADIFVPGQGPSTVASNPRGSRDALVRAQQVLVTFRDAVRQQIARGATEDQAAAAVVMPQFASMVGYEQQREVLVRRMYQDLKGTLR